MLLRSVEAGTTPVAMDLTDGFTPRAFAAATARLDPGVRSYTSLVPTQLLRLLDHPGGAEALGRLDAVLVGGAALPPHLRARAAAAGVTVVATYGMSETAGGCVYDGQPLPCTEVALDDTGRIHLGGATVAHGYLGRPDLTQAAFGTDEDGVRWFRTDDVGHTDERARLHVDGRLDDLVNTGGSRSRRGSSRRPSSPTSRECARSSSSGRRTRSGARPSASCSSSTPAPSSPPRAPPTCGPPCGASPRPRAAGAGAHRPGGAPGRAGQARPAWGGAALFTPSIMATCSATSPWSSASR